MFEILFKYPRDLYARSELTFAGLWPDWLPIVLAVIGIAAIIGFLFVRRTLAKPLQLTTIGLLQLAMLAIVLWLLQLPTLETEQLRAGENSVAMLLDSSASMAYGPERTRLVDARNVLEATMGDGGGLALPVQRYEFADGASGVESFAGSAPAGGRTAIADAVTTVLRQARTTPLAAVILASDGADTTGGITAEELAEISSFGVPVHTVAIGRTAMPEDLEISDVFLPARVLPDSRLSARVSIRHDGGGTTQLKVYDGDNLLASLPTELGADASTTTVWVDFELAEAGPHQLEFSVDGKEGEQELRNNRRVRLVEVIDDSYRILYYEGEPRWEYKFLRRAIQNDDDLQLVSLLRVSPNKFYRQGVDSADQLADGFPSTVEELYAYDALMIGSVEAASLTAAQQIMVRDFVSERGGSLLMLAGRNGLGSGGWGQSPVADALPTRLPQTDAESFFRVQAPVALTPQGNDSQMLRLAGTDDENQQAWRGLPEIADYQLTGTLKPAAVALLTTSTERGIQPLLVTQAFGRGRSFILATGGTWRWQMSLPVEDQRHETFWRQTLRTLVAGTPANTSLTATGAPGAGGIQLRAEFRDERFVPLDGVGVSAVVAREDGDSWTVPLSPSADEAGVFSGELDPDSSGVYFVEALAQRNDTPVATARASLAYEAGQAEHFGIRSNAAQLGRLSEATGGQLLAVDRLDDLPNLLRYSKAGVTEIQSHAIWDMPAAFLLLLFLKAGEWLLRRRWGTI